MLKEVLFSPKYLIYGAIFVIALVLQNLVMVDSNSMYIIFLASISILFLFDLYRNTRQEKKINRLVNVIEEMAKGNLKAELSIGSNTRKNLGKIEEQLTGLIKSYYDSNYNINIIKEKQKHMLSKYKEIAIFYITDRDGQQIYNSMDSKLANNGDRQYFKDAKITGKTQISDIVISKLTNKLAIMVAVPYFRGQEFAGIFGATIDMQTLSTSEEKLENALLGTMQNLKGLIRYLQSSGEQVAESAKFLSEISQQSASASESVAMSSYEVTKSAELQSNEVLSVTAAIQQIAASIQQVLASAEEIKHLSQEASNSASKGNKNVENAMESMDNLDQSSKEMQLSLDEINQSSAKMDEILKTIHSIADQTNLLALNASIEAARAGDAGRGFAVVADEIRKLAEGSKEATIEINNLIQEIQYKLERINRVVSEDRNHVELGNKTVKYAEESFSEIIGYVETVNSQVVSLTEVINELAQGSQNIATSANAIQQSSKDVSDEIQNVSAAAEEQTASMQEIASASENLRKLSNDLSDRANRFKL